MLPIDTTSPTRDLFERITREIDKIFVGQPELVLGTLVALFSNGHVLIESVPGLGKTLFVRTLGHVLGCRFGRIQFTADLMPSDITGAPIFDMKTQEFRFIPGPVFTQLLLADEINRSPAKTHAALLEIMQEYRVTVERTSHPIARPFLVLATQNPVESEGTYNLPEAQLDRFMFHVLVDYPSEDEEFRIVRQTTADVETQVTPTLDGEQILALQKIVRRVPVADHVIRYALDLVRRTRASAADVPDFIRSYVQWGAGPRASQYLILGAKARAVLQGRFFASCEDVRAVARPVLRHRILTNFNAEAEGIKTDEIVRRLIATTTHQDDGADGVFKMGAAK
jgi:MoxR-like ATPase